MVAKPKSSVGTSRLLPPMKLPLTAWAEWPATASMWWAPKSLVYETVLSHIHEKARLKLCVTKLVSKKLVALR